MPGESWDTSELSSHLEKVSMRRGSFLDRLAVGVTILNPSKPHNFPKRDDKNYQGVLYVPEKDPTHRT